ncbi:MAG: YceI family protein [Halieaceae bacterium]|nr:YceI family protein [Halieaceae bacterium]
MKSSQSKAKRWRLPLAMAAMLAAGSSWAQWQLESADSSVNFVSIKNASIAENNSFGSLQGSIDAAGAVQLSIELDSVTTGIEIRDERMRAMLFETVEFPTVSVSADVSPDILDAVTAGGAVTTELPVKVALHGFEKSLLISVRAVGHAGGSLHVFTPKPVLLNAADFGLAAGIVALQEIAGLNSINTVVPVTVNLVFNRAP